MIGQGVGHRPAAPAAAAAGRDQKKCKFEAAFESMQRAGPAAAAGSGGGGGGGAAAQGKGKREASAADAEEEERRKRERVEFLLQMVCWGPD